MKNIPYYLLFAANYFIALFPLRLLYLLSSGLYYIVYYLVGYRRKMVRKNIVNSYPDKSLDECIAIEKEFYRNFCDYFFETIKMLHFSEKEIRKRMELRNTEWMSEHLRQGRSVVIMLGHYGNWEWVANIATYVRVENALVGHVYSPLTNKAFDRFFYRLRDSFGSYGFAKNEVYREIIRMRRAGRPWLMGMIADQRPLRQGEHYWTTFLNQETAILTGSERIAKQTGAAVCYLDITRVKRGYYVADIKAIAEDPNATEEFEITERYARMMEETINRAPAYWLWSHNRWKHKRRVKK